MTSHILSFPLQTIFDVLSLIFSFANCLRCLIFFSAANDIAEGGREEEKERRRQDGVLRLSCLPRRAHGRNTLKYFASCPNIFFILEPCTFLRQPFNFLRFAQTPFKSEICTNIFFKKILQYLALCPNTSLHLNLARASFLRRLFTTVSPILCAASCQTPTRSQER